MSSWLTIKDKNGQTAPAERINDVVGRMTFDQLRRTREAEKVSVCGDEVMFEMPDGKVTRDRLRPKAN